MKKLALGFVVLAAVVVTAPASLGAPGQSFVSLDSYRVDFGGCRVTSPIPTTCLAHFTYTNIGSGALAEQASDFAKGDNFGPIDEYCSNFASGALSAGSFCVFTVGFTPTDTRNYNDQLCLNFPDASPSRVCVHLSGYGTA